MDEQTGIEVPLAIREAVRSAAEKRPMPTPSSAVKAGDIRRLNGTDRNTRLVLILHVDAKTDRAQFTLTHPYADLATDRDVVVSKAHTQLGYDLVIETDLRSIAWLAEFDRAVGCVSDEIVELCFQTQLVLSKDSPVWVGLPLIGPLDSRWDFKVSEGNAIRELSNATIEVTLAGESYWAIENSVFQTIFSKSPDSTAVALGLVELWVSQNETFVLTPEDLGQLDDLGLLSRDTWHQAMGPIANDFFTAVLQPLLDIAISDRRFRIPGRVYGISDLKELVSA